MVKEIIIITAIIVIVILGDIITQKYTANSVDLMIIEIDKISSDFISNKNSEKIEENYKKLYEVLENRFRVMAYYIEHDELEKVKTELVVFGSNMQTKEYEKRIEELKKAKYLLEHIKEREKFNLVNVF